MDIPEDSMTPTTTLDLVSGGEGGRRDAFPHFFGVNKASLDVYAPLSIISAPSLKTTITPEATTTTKGNNLV